MSFSTAPLVRTLSLILGIGAILWGGSFMRLFSEDTPRHRVASEYLLGRGFSNEVLVEEASPRASTDRPSFCDPSGLHDAVILNLAVFNNSIGRPTGAALDSDYDTLLRATRSALSCGPFDSLSWLVLFWLDSAKQGVNTRNLSYLRLSYALGPYEGWIAVWRNKLAIKLFAQLSPDLTDKALKEFVTLVDAGYLYREAAAIFASATPAVQLNLIEGLKAAKKARREGFAQALYDKGFDVSIPGVEKPARPWQ